MHGESVYMKFYRQNLISRDRNHLSVSWSKTHVGMLGLTAQGYRIPGGWNRTLYWLGWWLQNCVHTFVKSI